MKKALTVLVIFVLVIVGLGYLVLRPASQAKGRVLTIISPHTEGIREEFGRAFSQWHLEHFAEPAALEWLDQGGAADDLRYVRSQFAATPDGIPIDIFWGGGIEPYLQLAKEGLLQPCPLSEEHLQAIPREVGGFPMLDEAHRWYGAALSGFGIIYNKKRLRELQHPVPKTWEDLGTPRLLGEVGSADPRHSGATHACYEIILQAYGWEKGFEVVTRMAANVKAYLGSSGEVPKHVSLSDIACGLAIDFYAWAQIAHDGKDKIGYVLPQGLTVVNPDAIAVLKGTREPELARRFIQFVMTEPGQRLWVLPKGAEGGPQVYELNRIPALPQVFKKYREQSRITFDPDEFRSSFTYDPAKGSLRYAALNDLLGALVIDTHSELTAAWTAVIKADKVDGLSGRLGKPPLSEEELLRLARDQWKDPVFRNRQIAAWRAFAQAKYGAIASELSR